MKASNKGVQGTLHKVSGPLTPDVGIKNMNMTPIRHDYTKGTRDNGWAIMDFDYLDSGHVKIIAFGLKREMVNNTTRENKHLLSGEEVVISMPDGDVLYEISDISYHHDPCDMYNAKLKYIQHLSGLRILNQASDIQRARQLEWGKRKRTGDASH